MKLGKILGRVVIVLIGLFLIYVFFAPLPFDLGSWQPPVPPAPEGPYAPNSVLASVTRLELGGHFAPEDIALDRQGRIYGGTVDGKIVRLDADGTHPQVFADTHGRPLGLIFDASGNLLVSDADKGLLKVDPTGAITVLATEADGDPFRCTNDLDVAADGTIYFTDSSDKYPIQAFMIDLIEHQPRGRFMSYDPNTKKVTVLVPHRYFANGVAISPDQSFVLFVETGSYKVTRYWLKGPKQGTVDDFASDLPGIPDGILENGQGDYWVTLVSPRDPLFDWLMDHPFLRKAYLRLPGFMRPAQKEFAYVLELDANGHAVRNLQDTSSGAFIKITNAVEHDGQLYLGNIGQGAIGRVALPAMAN
ncbi:MAG TPA: SMP-30/gluconolactonase/LRE family protein [Opitutaceae bacterium]|jgi:sugar lactone lactonase YvrE